MKMQNDTNFYQFYLQFAEFKCEIYIFLSEELVHIQPHVMIVYYCKLHYVPLIKLLL